MHARTIAVPFRRKFHQSRLAQVGLLSLVWLAGEALVRILYLPVPGGIVGMLLLYAWLASGRVSLRSLRRGASWYLGEMLLFFIPAVPAVTAHPEFFGLLGVKVLAVILAGTVAVMCVTALTVDIFYRMGARHDGGGSVE